MTRFRSMFPTICSSEWFALFEASGFQLRCFRHLYNLGLDRLDFTSPLPSRASLDGFSFPESSFAGLLELPTISAVFALRSSDLDASSSVDPPGEVDDDPGELGA